MTRGGFGCDGVRFAAPASTDSRDGENGIAGPPFFLFWAGVGIWQVL